MQDELARLFDYSYRFHAAINAGEAEIADAWLADLSALEQHAASPRVRAKAGDLARAHRHHVRLEERELETLDAARDDLAISMANGNFSKAQRALQKLEVLVIEGTCAEVQNQARRAINRHFASSLSVTQA